MCIHIYVYTYIYPSTSTYIDTHTNTHTHPHPHTQVKKRLLLKTRYARKWQQGDKWFEIRLVSDVGTLNEGDVIEMQHLGLVQVTNIVWCVLCTYTHTYTHTYPHAYIHTHTHTHTYIHTHTYTHTYICRCMLTVVGLF
jgi:hypothetical protein